MPSIDKVYKINLVGGHIILYTCVIVLEYQPNGAGGTFLPPATPHHLQIQNGSQMAPKWLTGSRKEYNPRILAASINFN